MWWVGLAVAVAIGAKIWALWNWREVQQQVKDCEGRKPGVSDSDPGSEKSESMRLPRKIRTVLAQESL